METIEKTKEEIENKKEEIVNKILKNLAFGRKHDPYFKRKNNILINEYKNLRGAELIIGS